MMPTGFVSPTWVHYLPVGTTVLSVIFFVALIRRYVERRSGPHMLWWAGGVAFFGLGTATEALVTLFGNSPTRFKFWYVAGALLGGYPLAQGTVYLLVKRRQAHLLTALTLPLIGFLSILVFLSPIRPEVVQTYRLSGEALEWQWIRLCTPLINLYAAVFLVGGAMLSAARYFQARETRNRAVGNALIALGALLPGIGGGMAKVGMIEGLYVGELLGIILIGSGYVSCTRQGRPLNSCGGNRERIESR